MKKAITLLFLLLLVVLFLGVVLFFRGAPHLTPEPLKPVLSWADDAQTVVTEKWTQWQRQFTGEQAPVVASDSAASPDQLSQVTLGRNDVSTVSVDQNGTVAVKPPASPNNEPLAVEQPTSGTNNAVARADIPSGDQATPGETDQSSAELEAIAKADAAIAAADAALARAQGRPVPATAMAPRPIEMAPSSTGSSAASSAAEQANNAPGAAQDAAATGSRASAEAPGGSALGGASVALSQAGQAIKPVDPVAASEPLVLAAIPAPTVIPPDAPAPVPASSEAGRAQQAIIENFLAGEIVEFETGRDVLTRKGRQVLQSLLGVIEQHEDSVITIQGHTDSVGDERSNLELSTARAIAARSYLIRRGVAPDRLLVQGFGERKPISTNATAAGRERNRRIDFAVSDR